MNIQTASFAPLFFWKRKSQSVEYAGVFCLIMVLFTSSTSASFGKQLSAVFSPLSMLFLAEVMVFTSTIFAFGFLPIVRKVMKLQKKQILCLITIGLCNSVAAPLLAFSGLRMTSAINAELFASTESLFLILLAIIFLKEKIDRNQIVGGLLILTGVIAISLRGFSEAFVLQTGDLLILLAAFMYSCGAMIFKIHLKSMQHEVMLFVRTSTAITFFFVLSPFMNHTLVEELQKFPLELLAVLIGFGFISRFLNLLSFYGAMDRLEVRRVSTILPFAMISGIIFAHFYLGEALEWYHAIGGLSMLLGILIVQRSNLHASDKHLESHIRVHHRRHI